MCECDGENGIVSYGVPEKWEETVDVVVIGSGLAGLAAANEAGERGAKVLVTEKMAYYGGNSRISGGGYCCWDSKLKLREKLGLGEDTPELHKEDTLRAGGYYNDTALVDRLVQCAPDGLNWLIDAGVEFDELLHQIGGHSAPRSYQEKRGSGVEMVEALYARARALGAEFLLKTEVSRLWRENPSKPVTGVRVRNIAGGTYRNIRCRRGIVIASGGFARDTQLVAMNNPGLTGGYLCSNHKGATGEVIRLAKAIGAETLHMEFIQLYPCANADTGGIDRFALDCYSGAGYGLIYVNMAGERFVNELAGRDVVSGAQLRYQEKPTWAVLNGAIFEKLRTSGEAIDGAVRAGRIIAGRTLNELSERTGIAAKKLAETIDGHNVMLETGTRDAYGKQVTGRMLPMKTGTYYAIAQWPSVHFCMGGLRINPNAQVLDIWGGVIPGLYAAGEVCGGVHGANRLGGNALAECIVFGRIAGQGV